MLDTIQLRHPRPLPPPGELRERGFITICGHTPLEGAGAKWILNPPATVEKSLPRLTWSKSPDGEGWLTVEVSLPKFVFGSNVRLLGEGDLDRGLQAISDFTTQKAGVEFSAQTANVGRVDYCHSWQVGEANVLGYIAAVARSAVPRLTRNAVAETTVDFRNKSRAVVIYSKFAETAELLRKGKATGEELRESKGLLRVEARFFTSKSCRGVAEKLGFGYHKAEHLLTPRASLTVLSNVLEVLGMDKPVDAIDARVELLTRHFAGDERLLKLLGFLSARDHYGDERLLRLGIVPRASYYRYRRMLKDAGVNLETPGRKSLPPLRLVSVPSRKSKAA